MQIMRWSLASMFVMTALVAVACAVARNVTTDGNVVGWLIAIGATPILLGAAIGASVGRVGVGIWIGVLVDGGLGFLALLVLIAAETHHSIWLEPVIAVVSILLAVVIAARLRFPALTGRHRTSLLEFGRSQGENHAVDSGLSALACLGDVCEQRY
jgi:hypothetical protein